ncbi:hypothetical protein COCMIDRAFT_27514 [Bipolaris oryzae ATCC 44560]|uniref:Uncharacterized protein n=1 Tax=Bipolaris oryzae ATCC 44560 TaxID=930090 RepID=W6YXI3_COCMI|nr:uncharacterized protein COCMIDRAFT_27514 [Bipolaris oryzae ATCC 44560]EUC44127.1 hypothetical protein COCMIDRAFT_27514 [Bipolaris oryzae ATCC 44560]
MPPKKAAANGEATDGAFKWEGPNDLKLLLLTQGRYVKPEEYEQLSTAFPGTKVGSIRNHISILRIKQRDLYEQLGWTLPEGGTGPSTQKKTPKKRTADGSEAGDTARDTLSKKTPRSARKRSADADDDGVDTPSKKPRARKGGKGTGVKKEEKEEEEEEVLDTILGSVKEEEGVEDEI